MKNFFYRQRKPKMSPEKNSTSGVELVEQKASQHPGCGLGYGNFKAGLTREKLVAVGAAIKQIAGQEKDVDACHDESSNFEKLAHRINLHLFFPSKQIDYNSRHNPAQCKKETIDNRCGQKRLSHGGTDYQTCKNNFSAIVDEFREIVTNLFSHEQNIIKAGAPCQ